MPTADDVPDKLTIQSASTPAGKPFCSIRWGAQSGQLTPGEVRATALAWLAAAEAAEQDAMVLLELTDPAGLSLPVDLAGAVVGGIRSRRVQAQQLGEVDADPTNLVPNMAAQQDPAPS